MSKSNGASAFAPAAITNFFQTYHDSSGAPIGATGGGYVLSKGTLTRVSLIPGSERNLSTEVNGDPSYNARTTRRAVSMLLELARADFGKIKLSQTVETPIGSGFGSSGASAVSAVYATAKALGIDMPRTKLALFAHDAEIIERTGLGTASVVYDTVGAGAIVFPGIPGESRFVNVEVPKDVRLVTAFIAPYDKKDALNSKTIMDRIDKLGGKALSGFNADPSLDNLGKLGERFSDELGLESPEVKKLERLARRAGAKFASQNMIGYSVHAVVDLDSKEKVRRAFQTYDPSMRVDEFEVGAQKAGVLT